MSDQKRIISPAEARMWEMGYRLNKRHVAADLAHTAAVLGEEVDRLRTQLADVWDEGYDAGIRSGDRDSPANPYFRFEMTDTEKAYLKGDKA